MVNRKISFGRKIMFFENEIYVKILILKKLKSADFKKVTDM
jgi:hypothetical protein